MRKAHLLCAVFTSIPRPRRPQIVSLSRLSLQSMSIRTQVAKQLVEPTEVELCLLGEVHKR